MIYRDCCMSDCMDESHWLFHFAERASKCRRGINDEEHCDQFV